MEEVGRIGINSKQAFRFNNKQMKYFDVPLETLDHAWKVSVLQELVNSRTQNLYVEGFDDYVFTEMINMLCNE